MADNETIADIIAEMRNDAESDMNTEDGILGQTLYYLADRIEAALKREKAAIEADALEVGGIVEAAHRREISERVTRAVKNTAKIIDEQKRVGDAAKLREALEHLLHGEYRDRCEVTNIAHSALSAPPRNCDCFKTAAEAIDAYQDLTGDQLATDSGMKEWVEFAVWLFAPATEKEGGNNAD